jgi:tRNA threonylcarbamoyl adenosine modification protein (Sua5/YciO/YrdC/YwlC family)
MARLFDIHPANPQRRAIVQVAGILRAGGVIAYPTDSCYALGCQLGSRDGIARIRSIRHLDDRHHLTLVCQDFAQLGQFVNVANPVFRAIKAATPGSYTFILPATKEVPRRLQHPGKKTVGVRIPRHVVAQALLAELGEPLVSATLLLPGQDEPMTQGMGDRRAARRRRGRGDRLGRLRHRAHHGHRLLPARTRDRAPRGGRHVRF